MANGKGGPELSWQTIVGALSAVAILGAAGWTVFQTQFANIEKELVTDRAQIAALRADLDKYLTIREHAEYKGDVAHQIDDLGRRTAVIEATVAKAAREPVEKETFNSVTKATDDKINQLQNQVSTQTADLNLQVAAILKALTDTTSAAAGALRRP
jgi:uncharacterized protein HemX